MFLRRSLTLTLLVVLVTSSRVGRSAEIPDEAKKAIAALEQDVAIIQNKAEEEIKALEKRAEAEMLSRLEKCVAALQQVQDALTKAGKLDEAVALRERIKMLRVGAVDVQPNPGDLTKYRGLTGKVLYFEVIGASGDPIYGNDIYTDDSPLATAAVHAGVLKNSEKGVVKVTILASQAGFASTERNGIRSIEWGGYPGSYSVERASRIGAARNLSEPKKP